MKKTNAEKLHVWQPDMTLKGENPSEIVMEEVACKPDSLTIIFKDFYNNKIKIVYDQECPLEYVVWSFRYGTEIGRLDLTTLEQDFSNLYSEESPYFFKMSNSAFIKSFDSNHIANKELYPTVEHHLYVTGDDVFEVISNYEPKIYEYNDS